jgi:glutathione S-transferase
MMLKLHGFPVSNYTNMVELALREKGVPFAYVLATPAQTPEFLAKSPRGKIPVLETPQGFISETDVILEYLEETCPGRPLLPADPYARAQVRSLMQECELYLDQPARWCFGEAFFGATLPEAIKTKAREELVLGAATLERTGRFTPFVAGDTFTLADIVFLYTVELANTVTQRVFQFDVLSNLPAARALLKRLHENPHVQGIARKHDAAMPGFIAAMQARLKA